MSSIGNNVLIIRADNMGDLIMSGPAIRALKHSLQARITVLTSSMAAGIAAFMPEIDNVLVFDLPWVKLQAVANGTLIAELVEKLRQQNFDTAIIFTVFSQNPLPAAMIAFMAGIPNRVAYCRENPYALLTHWLPDHEPYNFIQHQVQRDIALVQSIGVVCTDRQLRINTDNAVEHSVTAKLTHAGILVNEPWIILHAGVSELKRQYPFEQWVALAQALIRQHHQVLFTGSGSERNLCEALVASAGPGAFSMAGVLNLAEFISLINMSKMVVSVNTGTVHIAAALQTPVVVLYAQTNPQHYPWMVPHKVLEFAVPEEGRSKNEVIQYLYKQVYNTPAPMPTVDEVLNAINELLGEGRIS